ncbi:MAG: PEGA domain-containing protein [Spirochaetes bacterium]|nr:PEGA domain-containing protein [Spirochaetota bacterium]
MPRPYGIPGDDLLERAVIVSRTMGAVLSGLGTGRISVTSHPSGASVFIDGYEAGTTPLSEFTVTAGEHEVRVVRSGYSAYRDTVSSRFAGSTQCPMSVSWLACCTCAITRGCWGRRNWWITRISSP